MSLTLGKLSSYTTTTDNIVNQITMLSSSLSSTTRHSRQIGWKPEDDQRLKITMIGIFSQKYIEQRQ